MVNVKNSSINPKIIHLKTSKYQIMHPCISKQTFIEERNIIFISTFTLLLGSNWRVVFLPLFILLYYKSIFQLFCHEICLPEYYNITFTLVLCSKYFCLLALCLTIIMDRKWEILYISSSLIFFHFGMIWLKFYLLGMKWQFQDSIILQVITNKLRVRLESRRNCITSK